MVTVLLVQKCRNGDVEVLFVAILQIGAVTLRDHRQIGSVFAGQFAVVQAHAEDLDGLVCAGLRRISRGAVHAAGKKQKDGARKQYQWQKPS